MKCIQVFQYLDIGSGKQLMRTHLLSWEEAIQRFKNQLALWHLDHNHHVMELLMKNNDKSQLHIYKCINCNERMIILTTTKKEVSHG